jgi:hypothetical protein
LLVDYDVDNPATNTSGRRSQIGVDIVDLMEEMLFQRAANGLRPVLYVSSYTDLECSMIMLLDDMGEVQWSGPPLPASKQVGYHMVTN